MECKTSELSVLKVAEQAHMTDGKPSLQPIGPIGPVAMSSREHEQRKNQEERFLKEGDACPKESFDNTSGSGRSYEKRGNEDSYFHKCWNET